jgi:hypothetical protein
MVKKCLLAMLAVACLLKAGVAQEAHGPDRSSSSHVPGVDVLALEGKPFSATSTIEWTRTTEDGNVVRTHLVASLARDSRGRIYRERHSFVPDGSDDKAPLKEVHLYDPTTRSQALCSTHAFECVLTDYRPVTFYEAEEPGTSRDGSRTMIRESLGNDTIDGIFVTGTRETTTIRAGAAGNDQPLVLIREFWYSDELETNLRVTRIDPRDGKQEIRLSHVVVGEPDVHLFDLPIGYHVRDLRSRALRTR